MEPKTIATNRKAFRDFFFSERWECGIALTGGEVKSLRAQSVNFTDSFALIENGEVLLYNLHIAPYEQASHFKVEPMRPRKLLLHRKEINKMAGLVSQKGYTLVPTKIFFNKRGFAKVELALGRGKRLYDKRADIKKREAEREMRRSLRFRQKGK